MRLESRINPKFLTLSENRISCVPTMTDDGKQWYEDREDVEKRMASVLSSLSLSWLLHTHAFMSSVLNCFYARFDFTDFSAERAATLAEVNRMEQRGGFDIGGDESVLQASKPTQCLWPV